MSNIILLYGRVMSPEIGRNTFFGSVRKFQLGYKLTHYVGLISAL